MSRISANTLDHEFMRIDMKRIVIFDFNRTLFDPDKNSLVPKTIEVLEMLKERGFKLYLVSRAGVFRKRLIESLEIKDYFARVVTRKEKRFKDFKVIAGQKNLDVRESFVVGDQLKNEILFGNRLGFKTIWINIEKINVQSLSKEERPTIIVKSLEQVVLVIK